MSKNSEDYAIVVGIQRYPGFGRTDKDARDLQGPDNDATLIGDWLRDARGGDIPPENVKVIRSKDHPDYPFSSVYAAEPQAAAIEKAFSRLEQKAQENNAQGRGLRVGRRLYLYSSGHGFAPRRKEGALFTAEATRTTVSHVFMSSWMQWFYNARYFDEYVLWMDCCMTFDLSITPRPGGYRIIQGVDGGGNMFAAYAARYPLNAVESQMADGSYHGAFTWALHQGLRGAAADTMTREVTSGSLKNYLINAMKTFMTQEQRDDTGVSHEPDFADDDPLVLARFEAVPSFPATVTFPAAAVGKAYVIETGSPPTAYTSGQVAAAVVPLQLPKGIYFARIPDLGLIRDFEILGGGHAINLA